MGKKAKPKARQAIDPPLDRERTREADYYARKVGMTRDEALRIIREADRPKLSIVRNDNAKRK
ncbi:MAG: hypothetical protein E5W55_10000 [Mesorhizobium sp.]|nr:MAG: hypothetical protein E5W55_10000 [Mesorhizobium sp.]